jgi:uncharacterized protein YaiL (DUF2058 family)
MFSNPSVVKQLRKIVARLTLLQQATENSKVKTNQRTKVQETKKQQKRTKSKIKH